MQRQNDKNHSFQGPKWVPPFAFIVMGLVGYAGFVWLRGNYLDALAIPLVVGFVWLAGMKQKLAWAVALVAFYVMLAVPAMSAGYMSWHLLTPILTTVILMVLGIAMYKLPLHKSVVMVVVVVLGLLLLYAADFVDKNTVIILSVGLGAGLLAAYLFPELRQSASQQ
ncbi:hypothetical protein [Candidatus Leptofilum sp.]|uniref:hypothetical protein n=1 Tax=Candidatus Leptofilum sp. TaxID=3241576 RepID=UPI003B5B3D6C